jgi:dTDP-4-amino-4,6-dideoxygalactose transaminase
MTDLAAALGLAQLSRYPAMLERRHALVSLYGDLLQAAGLAEKVAPLKHVTLDGRSSAHLFICRLAGADEAARNAVIAQMAELEVPCNVHYKPLPMFSAYRQRGWRIEDFPNAYALYANEITLPLHTSLSDDDVAYVVQCLALAVHDAGL